MNLVHPKGETPELLTLKLQVTLLTQIDRHALSQWRLRHWDELEDAFINSGLPLADKRSWVEHTYLAACRLNSRPVSAPDPSVAKSSGRVPARVFARLLRTGT